MSCDYQDIYLKIEPIYDYSPVDPAPGHTYEYRRDCFRRTGHENGVISEDEIHQRMLTALVYREYTNDTYTTMAATPLIASDLSEPPVDRRVPGAALFSRPGVRLRIHVLNGDNEPHSLHLHGIQYGIDSDGTFPFGVKNNAGVRSDQICPGKSYTYQYDVTPEMSGAWVFHDHFNKIGENAGRGLFGGLVVRAPEWNPDAVEVPFFMHKMAGRRSAPLFDSGDIAPNGTYHRAFDVAGSFDYRCALHPVMLGKVDVVSGGPTDVQVEIHDQVFKPETVTVGVGGTVHWSSVSAITHTVEESGSTASNTTYAINGRAFAGNTPVIQVESGQAIRWYVFNLDLGMEWHNFHPHASHWSFGGQHLDNRSVGPAEAFVVETTAPPVILPPCDEDAGPKRTVQLSASYPIHCHVEPHVMGGMVALMRATQEVEITAAQEEALGFPLPEEQLFACPVPEANFCVDAVDRGSWETLKEAPVFAVHGALLRTGKVMLWSGHAELGTTYPLESAQYDPASDTYTISPFGEDLFCAGMAFLDDGRLLAGGGANPGEVRSTHIFDPISETWARLDGGDLREPRWYPTMVTMSDGRVVIVSGFADGGRVVDDIEVLDLTKGPPNPGQTEHYWDRVEGSNKSFPGLYPGLHWLPSGDLFFSRTGWRSQGSPETAARFRFSDRIAGAWTEFAPMNGPDRKEGSSVLLIDDTGAQPQAWVFVVGGRSSEQEAINDCEMIDVSDPPNTPGWQRSAPMNHARIGVSSVILPDGTVMVVGGRKTFDRFDTDPDFALKCEIYDPDQDTWAVTPPMQYPRQYHSVAVLLPDGRVFTSGGVDARLGRYVAAGNQKSSEAYSPAYLNSANKRPKITEAPDNASYGDSIEIKSPQAAALRSICLISPGAITHHTDSSQRYIKLQFSRGTGDTLRVRMPRTADTATPGYYLLFVLDALKIPSVAKFIKLHP